MDTETFVILDVYEDVVKEVESMMHLITKQKEHNVHYQ